MDSSELREALDLAGLEVKATNDGVGTLLVRLPDRERKLRNPWFHLGPTHKAHPFLLAGTAELLTAKVRDGVEYDEYRLQLLRQIWDEDATPELATAEQRIRAAVRVLKGGKE